MKFSTVSIRLKLGRPLRWEAYFGDLNGDRVDEKLKPNGLGFYHYPRKMGKRKSFDELKAHLVAQHEKSIAEMTQSLSALKALEFDGN